MDPQVRGAFLAQIFYGELEKIANAVNMRQAHEMFQEAVSAAKPDLWHAARHGDIRNFAGSVRQNLAMRGLSSTAKKHHARDIERLRSSYLQALQHPDHNVRAEALEGLQNIVNAGGRKKSSGESSVYMDHAQKAMHHMSGSTALLGTGAGLGLAGGAYLAHRLGQSDQPAGY